MAVYEILAKGANHWRVSSLGYLSVMQEISIH